MESKKVGKNQRFLSPSFKKGAIKETKKNEDFQKKRRISHKFNGSRK